MEEDKVQKKVSKEEQGDRRRRDGGRREKQTKDNLHEERNFKNYATGEMEKVVVTPDTELEAIPNKADRVKEPSEDTFHNTLDKLDDQKDQLWEDFKKYAKEVRQSVYNSKQEGGETTNLFTDLKEKQAQRKVLRQEMKGLKDTLEEQKKGLDDIAEEQNKLKLKMKRLMKKDELEQLLADYKYQQANGRLSLYDEKQLCKQIQDLEDSLPFAGPLEALEVKRGPLKKAKDQQAKLMKDLWTKMDLLTKDIDVLSAEYDSIKKTKNAQYDNIDPAIELRKKDTQDKMDVIKVQKKKVITDYREGCRQYDIQQQLIKKLDWMLQAKTRLVKYKAQLEEDEARRIVQQEEMKDLQDNVYSEEIRMCQFLIRYCKNFQKKAQQEQQNKEAVKDTSCLQNEILEVVCKKKDVQMDYHVQTKGKKVNKRVEAKVVDDTKISHKLDVLEFFEQMKVTAPTRKQIDDTIKLLEEKEKYFLEQSELKKKENVDVIEEEKKKLRERENEKRKHESNYEKKQKDRRAKMNAQFKEDEYPEM